MTRLWWATVSAYPVATSLLTPAEIARMGRYRRQVDQDRFGVAWTLTRRVLGEITGADPETLAFSRQCRHCAHPDHGKPHLADGGPDFSLSHAGDRVVLAVTGTGLVGVDVERADHDVEALGRMILHPDEPAATGTDLLRVWVSKEAVLKATGEGIVRPMTSVNLADLPEGTVIRDIDADDGYIAAMATVDASMR